ncbi:Hypothetical_protein [Hexamita inflata]|uniref:Hypothetical_protein n=1 Tax=Hexamita inflata TaxID=28002 RepID=A0AA86R7I7_9EUKA|nr:Hypothetical protein HINF_LOCUS55134 [Hexamita inflata]
MQTIIRTNISDGIDPATGQNADKKRVETAFVRVPLHQNFHQACLSNQSQEMPINKAFKRPLFVYHFMKVFTRRAQTQLIYQNQLIIFLLTVTSAMDLTVNSQFHRNSKLLFS